ncbi:Ger(x)C family spore germination protein [Brevibacillus borstelensis]|jgi:Ger(x)C family germination protein|uniref:Ger(x)C family spore germination protein n=1 Tax=Brevibacillus TaxID=55080 RepID=UPI001FAB2A97|nr:Ger(x)C family spore germination protein [Brevibacillus borstelensis]MCM3471896.1 Ger(x)C family spore germination protein [Brevibacillus borstelensis]MCM3591004.1 Ger(x)C family spore germination protein [Brevibacillus borstelensis]
MERTKRMIAVVLAASILLGGCWNARDIEQLIYIDAIGVDYVNHKVVVYLQILGFSNIAKKESNTQLTREPVSVAKGEGDTYVSAIYQIYTTTQQRLIWSHVHSIVFTERALKHGKFDQVMDALDRYQEFRYSVWSFATKESLEDVFNARPILGISVLYSQLADPKDIYGQFSYIRPLLLFRVISERNEPNGAVRLPFLSVEKKPWTENKKPLPQLKINGICFLQNKELKGCLPHEQVAGVRWLEKETRRTLLKSGKKSALLVMESPRPKIIPGLEKGRPIFRISIKTTGYVTQLFQPTRIALLEKDAARQIEAEVRSLYDRGLKLGIDTLELGHSFYRKFPREWHHLNQEGVLPLTPDSLKSIEVEVKITDGGISKVRQRKTGADDRR